MWVNGVFRPGIESVRSTLNSAPVTAPMYINQGASSTPLPKSGTPTGEAVDVEGLGRYLARAEVVFAVMFGSHAQGFVDVSDIETVPTPVAYAALRDGIVLAGDEGAAEEGVIERLAYPTDESFAPAEQGVDRNRVAL